MMLVAALFFVPFAVLSVMQGAKMNDARAEAQSHFDQLNQFSSLCTIQSSSDESCRNMAAARRQFDRSVDVIRHHRSLMVLFLAFALFIPALVWAAFLLTGKIFVSDVYNQQFDEKKDN